MAGERREQETARLVTAIKRIFTASPGLDPARIPSGEGPEPAAVPVPVAARDPGAVFGGRGLVTADRAHSVLRAFRQA
jgi:hypothetical protein